MVGVSCVHLREMPAQHNLCRAAPLDKALSQDNLRAVSKRGLASGHAAGMADVFAWLKKDGGIQDVKPQLF